MTIRYTEREKFRDKWYRSLTPVQKCIWEYLLSECDHAGLIEFDVRIMSIQIGADITIEDLRAFEKIGKIRFVRDDTIFIPNFVLFQQRIENLGQLNPRNRCHKSILERLKKYKICPIEGAYDAPYVAPIQGASDTNLQETTKSIDIVEDLSPLISPLYSPYDRGYSNSNSNSNSNSIDIYCNKDFDKCFKIYSENCNNLIPLNFERRNKKTLEALRDFLVEINFDFEYFKKLCIEANQLKKIVDTKIDFRMLLNNHAGIMAGKYAKTKKSVKDYKY